MTKETYNQINEHIQFYAALEGVSFQDLFNFARMICLVYGYTIEEFQSFWDEKATGESNIIKITLSFNLN
jgi:hypothetical protein